MRGDRSEVDSDGGDGEASAPGGFGIRRANHKAGQPWQEAENYASPNVVVVSRDPTVSTQWSACDGKIQTLISC